MKVTPIKDYREPRYPTIAEIGSADLSRVPTRWQNLKAVAASLGAAAMTLKAISLEAAETANDTRPSAEASQQPATSAQRPVEAQRQQAPITDVCPLLPAKIAGDGRGAFGCVAMNPPVMLPEGEALDIIEAEFKKRGIELVDGVELKGIKAPPRGKEAEKYRQTLADFVKKGGKYDSCATSKGAPLPLVKRNWRADFGTKDGKIVVEYVSKRDEAVWNKSWLSDKGWCSVSAYDTRGAAERVVEGVSARTEGDPVTVGVFYDPMAQLPMARKKDGSIDWEAEHRKPRLSWEERTTKSKAIAVEQLKAQIESFSQYLAKKNAPHAASH